MGEMLLNTHSYRCQLVTVCRCVAGLPFPGKDTQWTGAWLFVSVKHRLKTQALEKPLLTTDACLLGWQSTVEGKETNPGTKGKGPAALRR